MVTFLNIFFQFEKLRLFIKIFTIRSFGCVLYEMAELKQLFPSPGFGIPKGICDGEIPDIENNLINDIYKK